MKKFFMLIGLACLYAIHPVAAQNSADSHPAYLLLKDYHWQLTEANTAKNKPIKAFFIQSGKPVQLDFQGSRMNVKNACNLMSVSYHIDGQDIIIGERLISTLRACVDARLDKLDKEISLRLKENARLRLLFGQPPVLVLKTSSGDTLTFTGTPTAEKLYGNSETVFLEVAAKTRACSHPLIPNKQCLQVREVFFDKNGLKAGTPGEWENFYDDIEGYAHQDGVRNVLRVKRFKRNDPPADAPSLVYILDMVVESETIKP